MAENKKSFLLYADLIHTVKKMPKDKAGELFLTILEYVNDVDPIVDDLLVDLVFEPIKQQLKRDLKHWENVKSVRSDNGKKGGRPKKQIKANKPNALIEKQTEAKKAVTVNDTVNVTVNDNVNEIKEENKIPAFNFRKSLLELNVESNIVEDWLKVRKTKKASNTETAFKAIKKQIDITSHSANDCIKKATEKSWSGFKAEWYMNDLNENKKNENNKQSTATPRRKFNLIKSKY